MIKYKINMGKANKKITDYSKLLDTMPYRCYFNGKSETNQAKKQTNVT